MVVSEQARSVNPRPSVSVGRRAAARTSAAARAAALPTWFVATLAAAVTFCAVAGVSAVLLLDVDLYRPAIPIVVGGAAAAGVAVLAYRRLDGPMARAHGSAVAAVCLALAFFAFGGAFHSEHLLTDRDPAAYIDTGRSIAGTHELHPAIRPGPYADSTTYVVSSPTDFGFPMLPALLALAWSAGGDTALFWMPVFLGTLGLLACYALAARLVGPRWALFAFGLMAIAPFQLWFARDAYSELVVQPVVLAGVWLYLEARDHMCASAAAIAGFLLGAAGFARIDALLVVVGVVPFLALDWVRCDRDASPVQSRRVVVAGSAALGVTALAALLVTRQMAKSYVSALAGQYRELSLLALASALGFAAVVVVHRLRPGIAHSVAGRRTVPVVATVVSTGIFSWAYFVRPAPLRALPPPRPLAQVTPEVRAAINDWHFSRSLHWFTSYMGLIAIFAAFVGIVVLGWRAWRGARSAAAVFMLVVPSAVLYLARPNISPDQPWAMRRYLPVVLPGIMIVLALVLRVSWHTARRLPRPIGGAVALTGVAVLVVLVVVPSAWAARPFARARMQHGALPAVHEICRAVDDDGAVLVYGSGTSQIELPQTVRSFCDVPAAVMRDSRDLDLEALAGQWAKSGRHLFVVTTSAPKVQENAPEARVLAHTSIPDDSEPERVLDRRPVRSRPVPVQDIWVVAIPPPS